MPFVTTHLGFGKFQLADLLPGEAFNRFDGAPCEVVRRQPKCIADFVQIWQDAGTSNARKILLHRTALVYATSPEQARRISRRIAQRKRRTLCP